MNALMAIKHPPVTWPDVRRMYYWVPTSTLFLFMATVALRGALGLGLPRLAVRVVLVSNLASLPTHRHYLETDHLSAEMAYSPSLLEALKHTADSAYDPGGTVGEGPVYQLALRWRVSGDPSFAAAAARILDAWATTLTAFTGDSNVDLRAGLRNVFGGEAPRPGVLRQSPHDQHNA